jgi:two-component system, cell cycle sensor histidine kinase and response regulator CckA
MKPELVPEESAVGTVTAVAEGTFLELTRQMSAKIGLGRLDAIVRNLAEALHADGVFVGEFAPNSVARVTIVAATPESELANPPFTLAGSACARIAVTGHPVLCRKNALDRFPADPLLSRLRAEACIAVPLKDISGRPIGAMLAAYRSPVASFRAAQSILEVFAPRAAAELLHRQRKDGLRKSEERYDAFVSRSEDGMWCVEFDRPIPTDLPPEEQLALVYRHSYYSECNDAAAKLLGLGASGEMVGRHTVDVLSKSGVRKAFFELVRSAYRFTTSETARPLPDGRRHFMLRSQLGIVEDGMLRRVWGLTHDITDFKRAQRALDASRRRMIDLLESVQLFVVVLDPSGAIEACSNYFAELTDWRSDDLKGKNWFELTVPPEERAELQEKFAVQLKSPKKSIHFESTLLGPTGRRWQVAWDSTALRDEKLEVKAVANIGRDITQEKAIESHLRQAQRVESIGRLAGGIAHDFNNLLAVIGGYASQLLDRHTPGDQEYPELSEIRNAVETAAQLTQQLLTFSRRRASSPEALNLNRIVERDCSMLRRTLGNDIDLVTSLDPSLGLVRIDPVEMSQVLLNLAVNARDAMPRGGKLTIASSNAIVSDGQGSGAPAVPAGKYVQLTVTDTGTGMTTEVLDRLFEPFFTTKEAGKGTGLGLSIIFGIVKQSGGHIRVESAPGRGASFRIFLPRTRAESPFV